MHNYPAWVGASLKIYLKFDLKFHSRSGQFFIKFSFNFKRGARPSSL